MKRVVIADEILFQLGHVRCPVSLGWLCENLGIRPGRGGRYSSEMSRRYVAVSAELARLKRAGKVEFVRGKGAGWRLVRGRS